MASKGLDGAFELIADVQFVRVKEQEDAIDAFGEPFEDADEVVAAIGALLLAAQDSRRVDDRNALEDFAGRLRALEAV